MGCREAVQTFFEHSIRSFALGIKCCATICGRRRAAEKRYEFASSHLVLPKTYRIRIYNNGNRQSLDILSTQSASPSWLTDTMPSVLVPAGY